MTPNKKIIIASVVIAVFVVTIIVLVVTRNSSESTGSKTDIVDQNTYVDESSGETVLSPEGKVTEGAIQNTDVTVLGFSKLIDNGVSSSQVDTIKQYIDEFALEQKANKVSLVVSTIAQKVDKNSGQKDITADIKVSDAVVYKLSLSYVGFTDMLMYVYSTDGSLVYSSPYDD
jgi:hypothetical protein